MTLNERKLAKQIEGIGAWIKAGGIGIAKAPAGFGKTYMGCLAIKKYLDDHQDSRPIIIAPNEVVVGQWTDQLNEMGLEPYGIEVYTKMQVINFGYEDTTLFACDLLVIDEPQKLLTDLGKRILNGNILKFKYVLGLTATTPAELLEYLPIVWEITEIDCINQGFISLYKEYCLPVELNADEKALYTKYTLHIADVLKTYQGSLELLKAYYPQMYGVDTRYIFKSDYEVLQSCQTGKKLGSTGYINPTTIREGLAAARGWTRNLDLSIPSNQDLDKYYNPNNLSEQSKVFNEIVRRRNIDLINNAEDKVRATIDIINEFPHAKIITFSQSTVFCDKLTDLLISHGIAATKYHSAIESQPAIDPETGDYFRTKKTGAIKIRGKGYFRDEAISGMRTDKYRVLNTVASLNEGLDIPDLSIAIVTSGDCNPFMQYQRTSRAKRINPLDPDKLTYIFNVYIQDFFNNETSQLVKSRDLVKLKERLGNKNVGWINNLNDIYK